MLHILPGGNAQPQMPTHGSTAPQSEKGLWEPPTLQIEKPSLRNTANEQEDARPILKAYYSFKETELMWKRIKRRKEGLKKERIAGIGREEVHRWINI